MATFDSKSWEWDTGEKLIAETNEWKDKFEWVEEFQVSPDGETVASIVKVGEMEFSVCVNGETWEVAFDKIWYLRFGPDGRLTALVSKDEEWTVVVDGESWENTFGYVWNTKFGPGGRNIAVAIQQEMQYGAAVNGEPWENMFPNMTNFIMSPDGTNSWCGSDKRIRRGRDLSVSGRMLHGGSRWQDLGQELRQCLGYGL